MAPIVVAAIGLTGCAASETQTEQSSLTIGVPNLSVNWDPTTGAAITALQWDGGAGGAVYDPLWYFDNPDSVLDGEFDPWLAESFELSEDRRTVTVELRDDVDFVDGEHLDAAAVAKVFDILIATEGTTAAALLGPVDTVFTATGEYTLEITTSSPISRGWMFAVAITPVASPAAMASPDIFQEGPVGSGPYLVDEAIGDVEISFVRNPDYWNPEAYPYDRVTLKKFSDDIAQLNALKTGQIDIATRMTIAIALEAEASGFTLHGEGKETFGTLFVIDHEGLIQPALGDVRVRRALNMAFDRESILEVLNHGRGWISSQPFLEDQPEYVEGGDERYTYDPERARELLAEGGYPDGFAVTIPTFAGDTGHLEPIVQQSLGDIGIEVTFEHLPDYPAMVASWTSGEYTLALHVEAFGNAVGSVANARGGFDGDPEAAAIFERMNTGTWSDWEAASSEMGEFLLDQAWFVPFWHPSIVHASIPEVDVWLQAPGRTGETTPFLRDFYPAELESRPSS